MYYELRKWYQSDDEDENEDTNLLLQASNEFEQTVAAYSTTSLELLPQLISSFNEQLSLIRILTDIQRVDSS